MQNEASVFHRALEPDLLTCRVRTCQSKCLWLLPVLWQWWHRAVGSGESPAVAGAAQGISDDLCSLLIRQTSQNAW